MDYEFFLLITAGLICMSAAVWNYHKMTSPEVWYKDKLIYGLKAVFWAVITVGLAIAQVIKHGG